MTTQAMTEPGFFVKMKEGLKWGDVPKTAVEFRLEDDWFTRTEPLPIRFLDDLKFHFIAEDWDEVLLYNFRLVEELPPAKVQWSDHGAPSKWDQYYRCQKESGGFFLNDVMLAKDIRQYVIDFANGEVEYAALKFDVLAKKSDRWFMVDPGTGIKPRP